MKHIFEYNRYNNDVIEKLNKMVEISLKLEGGGEKFFDMIDDMIKDEDNEDIIIELFNQIKKDNGDKFNIALSGSFGERILFMIRSNKIRFNGKYVLFNGSILTDLFE